MNKYFKRIISLILCLCLLLGAMPIASLAAEDESLETDSEEKDEGGVKLPYAPKDLHVITNRTFDEGWAITNGFTKSNNAGIQHNFYFDYEVLPDYSYNNFYRLESTGGSQTFIEAKFDIDSDVKNGAVLEFDIKSDDWCSLGNIIAMRSIGTVEDPIYWMLNVTDNYFTFFGQKTSYKISAEWQRLTYVFDFVDYVVRIYIDYEEVFAYQLDPENKGTLVQWIRMQVPQGAPVGESWCMDNFTLYSGTTTLYDVPEDNYGITVALNQSKTENIMVNTGEKNTAQLLAESLFMKVGLDYAYYNVRGNESNERERVPIFTDSDGNIFGAPIADENGDILIPLELVLEFIGLPVYQHPDGVSFDIATDNGATYIAIGRDSATVEGTVVALNGAPRYIIDGDNQYIAVYLDDIEKLFPSWFVTYDSMGLIVISEKDDVVNRNDDLELMLDIMKAFIFDNPEGETVFEDAKAHTDGFKHPYLMADQEKFDELNGIYLKTRDEGAEHPLLAGINRYESTSKRILAIYEWDDFFDAQGINIDEIDLSDGSFEFSGKHISKYSGKYLFIEFKPDRLLRYHITVSEISEQEYNTELDELPELPEGEERETRSVLYGSLTHYTREAPYYDPNGWNTGYDPLGGRLNEATGLAEYVQTLAMGYQLTRDETYAHLAYELAEALCNWPHWGPGHFLNCADTTANISIGYDWLYNIWVELGYDVDKIANGIFENGVHEGYLGTFYRICEHDRGMNLNTVDYNIKTWNWNAVCSSGMMIGCLALFDKVEANSDMWNEIMPLITDNLYHMGIYGLDEYAPDGSYIESPGYWAYGTNSFFEMVMALVTTTGTDYNFMKSWGIDRTCYYVINIMSNEYMTWNYHDGGDAGTVDCSMFGFVGQLIGDGNIVAIRQNMLANGSSCLIYDLIWYDEKYDDLEVSLPLQYYMEGIDGYVVRSSWNDGAIYAGLMGGANDCSHSDIDSGNFIYYSSGTIWFMDLGSEDYNSYKHLDVNYKYSYYRKSAEGQNVMVMTSKQDIYPYGQRYSAGGVIEKTYDNEYGAYAILDNSSVYGEYVLEARRGILYTNDRKTVVIQDELTTSSTMEEFVWVAHTSQNLILKDSKTAYMTDEYGNCIRISLVTQQSKLGFTITNATSEFLLDATFEQGYSASMGANPEFGRSDIKRLCIDMGLTTVCKLAVVIEEVEDMNDNRPVGYSIVDMRYWEPSKSSTGAEVGEDDNTKLDISAITPSDMNVSIMKIEQYINEGTALDTRKTYFYRELVVLAAGYTKYRPNASASLSNIYNKYVEYLEYYNLYRDQVAEKLGCASTLASILSMVDTSVPEA